MLSLLFCVSTLAAEWRIEGDRRLGCRPWERTNTICSSFSNVLRQKKSNEVDHFKKLKPVAEASLLTLKYNCKAKIYSSIHY